VSQITKDIPALDIAACIHEILSRQPRSGSHFADGGIRFKIWNQGRPQGRDR